MCVLMYSELSTYNYNHQGWMVLPMVYSLLCMRQCKGNYFPSVNLSVHSLKIDFSTYSVA